MTPAPSGDARTGYVIEGFVGKSSSLPASGVTVLLVDADSGKTFDSAVTNFFGKYFFEGLTPGSYLVKVEKIEVTVVIRNESKRLDIDLSAPGGAMDYAKTGAPAPAAAAETKPAEGAGPAVAGGDADLLRKMAGDYWGYSGSTETRLLLRPDGTFADSTESSYSNTPGTSAWGTVNSASGSGRWTVEGTQSEGRITLHYANGKRNVVRYRYDPGKGCYWFGGTLLCKR
jgi:hypothetical protein